MKRSLLGPGKSLQPPNPVQIIKEIAGAVSEYQKVREQEKTRRAQIRAEAKVAIERIRAQANLLREFFGMLFAERRENFERSFALLEEGLREGNNQKIEVALAMIVTLVKESPLRQAEALVQKIRERKEKEMIEL